MSFTRDEIQGIREYALKLTELSAGILVGRGDALGQKAEYKKSLLWLVGDYGFDPIRRIFEYKLPGKVPHLKELQGTILDDTKGLGWITVYEGRLQPSFTVGMDFDGFVNELRSAADEAEKIVSESEQSLNGPGQPGDDQLPGGIPSEPVPQDTRDVGAQSMDWDVFISHASEDKEAFVRPLATALQKKNLRVWFDEFSLTVGDSLRRSIDHGLAHSRYGIVVISPDFLRKEWPQKELDGLVAQEVDGRKVILPVWHNLDDKTVRQHSPLLADRVATSTAKGVDAVVADLMKAIEGRSK